MQENLLAFVNVIVDATGEFKANSNIEDRQQLASLLLDVVKSIVLGLKVEQPRIVVPPANLAEKVIKQ